MKCLWSVALIFVLVGCASTSPTGGDAGSAPKQGAVTLIYQSNRHGSLEPCGCQVNPFGGLDREMNAVQGIRSTAKSVLYVDAGNMFIPPQPKAPVEHFRAKAEAITEMLNTVGLEVAAVGQDDLQLSVETLKSLGSKAKFKWVSTNIVGTDGKPVFPSSLIETRDGIRYLIVTATPVGAAADKSVKIEDPKARIEKEIADNSGKYDVVLVLSQLKSAETEKLAKDVPAIQLVVGADPVLSTENAFLIEKGRALYVDPVNLGYRLGRVDIGMNLPFKGFYSFRMIRENKELIKKLEGDLAKKPNDESLKKQLENAKAGGNTEIVAGGSSYNDELIRLDAKRYGKANEITKMMKAEKEATRKRALKKG